MSPYTKVLLKLTEKGQYFSISVPLLSPVTLYWSTNKRSILQKQQEPCEVNWWQALLKLLLWIMYSQDFRDDWKAPSFPEMIRMVWKHCYFPKKHDVKQVKVKLQLRFTEEAWHEGLWWSKMFVTGWEHLHSDLFTYCVCAWHRSVFLSVLIACLTYFIPCAYIHILHNGKV
jgi:hypothetical protein